ncbi:MAG: mycothiol conjugate amidase Mca [Acidimicrobiia bacterium]|nr:mycothiol conjugate amidase Mca [Acidimicrobiia bacterium]
MQRTLLALHAHPDDESSKGAGTVSRLASEGVDCILVTATGGEAGDILNPAMDRPEVIKNLAAVRREELMDAAGIQGYKEVILLGYRDSGMPGSADNADPRAFCNQPVDDVLEKLVRIVRRIQPDVVLGYDAHEFYPHPDHLRVHEMSTLVFTAAADPTCFPDAGPPWQIKRLYAPHVFTRRKMEMLDAAMIERFGTSPYADWIGRLDDRPEPGVPPTITRVDVTGFVEQGRDALRAHRTQVDPDGRWFAVPTDLIEAVYPWEEFELLAAAVDTAPDADDLFHGLG